MLRIIQLYELHKAVLLLPERLALGGGRVGRWHITVIGRWRSVMTIRSELLVHSLL
jgi:hypothetical protein